MYIKNNKQTHLTTLNLFLDVIVIYENKQLLVIKIAFFQTIFIISPFNAFSKPC